MARVTAQEAADKWAARTAAASQDYARGIQRVTQAPGAAAAAKKADYIAHVNESADKWARNVGNVSLGDWQQMASTKGAQNLSVGVNAAKNKMASRMQKVLADVDSAVAAIKTMPTTTLDQRINRSVEFQRRMNAASKTGNR